MTQTHTYDPQRQITVTDDGIPVALSATAFSQTPSNGYGTREEHDMIDYTGSLAGVGSAALPDPSRVPLALALHTRHTEPGSAAA